MTKRRKKVCLRSQVCTVQRVIRKYKKRKRLKIRPKICSEHPIYRSKTDRILSQMSTKSDDRLATIVTLFSEGYSLPFIARYKQKETGPVDERELRQIDLEFSTLMEIETRRDEAVLLLRSQPDTPNRQSLIDECMEAHTVAQIDEIMEFKRTSEKEIGFQKATCDFGAVTIFLDIQAILRNMHAEIVHKDATPQCTKNVQILIAHSVWRDDDLRELCRRIFTRKCEILQKIKPHQWMKIRREKDYSVFEPDIILAIPEVVDKVYAAMHKRPRTHGYTQIVKLGVQLAISDYFVPALYEEWIRILNIRADAEAIEYFKVNLRNKLAQPGLGPVSVIGIDPGLTSGCKAVYINENGDIVHAWKFYTRDDSCTDKFFNEIENITTSESRPIIVLGDGTGSNECRVYLTGIVSSPDWKICLVSESGASRYSISELGMRELPNMDVEYRGAVSIARRAIDPLSEYCKIDPKHLSVGMYQHDIIQHLDQYLPKVVSECINEIDVNTASEYVLQFVPGLTPEFARTIIQHRPFKNRRQLADILPHQTWTHSIGFLLVKNSNWTPLDATCIHPNDYSIANQILQNDANFFSPHIPQHTGCEITQEMKASLYELLTHPTKKPIEPIHVAPIQTKQSSQNTKITGTVRNITAFGAFVNIGANSNDALLHISEYPTGITDPHYYRVNQTVQVKIIKITPGNKERIELSVRF